MIIEKINYLMPSVIEADLSALLWQPNTFPGSDTFNQLIVTGLIVFWIGLTGIFFNRRLVISILLAVELTLLSINLLMLTFAAAMEDLVGVMFALYILCVAAAESAIGLALIIIWYRVRRTVSVQYISLLKG
uniref:NADH-ubiquinone oxidoreductase subunit 4L n=4 Tax=Ulva TaxID=3118 RepID=A0A3G2ZMV4_9CHLO|nr:NADH-ubiquinone oxidoreductase subunit 4L [Ulva expansa]YP_010021559.1 NADH-ubiquinone oxidoreductase subunit 4L [Ulva rigida]AYP41040.1 NADH-ubiquinone oxidoreductase subunit 4L [Ulva expansa]QOL10400.1 NADH-ubiquinone oxidoreductase subunit 4L [Ulva rigida]